MMYGPEKSDSAIVATRPTNKAGRPAAEPVERRAGTKGNVGQQSTHRTQHRTARVTGAGTHTAGCRHTPEVGAVCGKAARTDLCGGRPAMGVPTATKVLGLGITDPITGMIADWTGMILTAYVGGRSIEKVARIFRR